MAMMSSSIWFFCIFLTSLTGSIAYGLWKILEHVLQQKRKYSWLFLSSKLVILFWIVPFVFLQVTFHAYDYWNHTWKSDVFSFGREIRKWGVCLLSILFLGMVSIVSYAAGETILSGYGMLTDATGVLIEEAPTIEPELEEEIIQAGEESHVLEIEMPIESEKGFQNWDIPVNALYMTPNFYCSASQKVDVLVYISPTDQLTRVGIMEPDGTRRAVSSEGRINHTFSVNQSGNYRVYIENQSDVPISVEFYFNVY